MAQTRQRSQPLIIGKDEIGATATSVRPADRFLGEIVALQVAASETLDLVLEFELAFFCHPLKRLAGIFDPILIVIAFGRQQLNHLVSPAGAGTGDGA